MLTGPGPLRVKTTVAGKGLGDTRAVVGRYACSGSSRKAVYARCKEARLPMPPWKAFHGHGHGSAGRGTCCDADGMLQVKAFACILAGDNDGGALGRYSPRWGCHLGAPSLQHGVLWVKTLSSSLDKCRQRHWHHPLLGGVVS